MRRINQSVYKSNWFSSDLSIGDTETILEGPTVGNEVDIQLENSAIEAAEAIGSTPQDVSIDEEIGGLQRKNFIEVGYQNIILSKLTNLFFREILSAKKVEML